MNSYVNEFSISLNAATDEVVLILRQNLPSFKENGEFESEKKETVASFIMPVRCASALADALTTMPGISPALSETDNE